MKGKHRMPNGKMMMGKTHPKGMPKSMSKKMGKKGK